MSPRVRVWLLRGVLVVVSLAAAFTVVELVLRSRAPRRPGLDFFMPPPAGLDLPYVLAPGAEVRFEGHYVKIPPTTIRISAQSFREEAPVVVPKPAGRRRVVALGDSFVFGSGVEVGETFVQRAEAALPGVEIVNMGVPGYTSAHAVTWFEARGLALQPDEVILFVSDNDFYADGRARLRERQEEGGGWSAETWVRGRLKAREKAGRSWRHARAEVLDRLLAAIARLRALCVPRAITLRVVMLFPHALEADIRASEPGLVTLADAAYMKDIERLQIPRDLHPNAEGHRRLGELLAALLATPPRR